MRTKIIFDNDGVNINSEDVAMRVMDDWGVAFVQKYNPAATVKTDYIYRKYPGTSTNKIVEALINEFSLPLEKIVKDNGLVANADLKEIGLHLAGHVTVATNKRFETQLESVPGTTQALEKIREVFGAENIALMTTSPKDRMDVSLKHAVDPVTGENARLEEMFPAGPLRRSGYGHDNKYDEGFGALGWNSDKAIIVEDSLSGVSKAKAGREGVFVIGTAAARFYEDKGAQAQALIDKGADIVITSMNDLPAAAAWLKNEKKGPLPKFVGQVFLPPSPPALKMAPLSKRQPK